MKKFFKSFFLTLLAFLFACPAGLITYAQESTKVDLESTPIDVVYCYADLWDHTLKRGDPELNNSIKKDYDNQELKYSLRSVLKNIPWVRKIFIIMPNDKVRFLKEPDEIKDRIVYVKNEDLLGFDTNSPHVKQFNMWRLKEKFGCSNHIICMDDDMFIGKPLKKSDFFYVENNKVVPYAVNHNWRPRIRKLNDVIMEKAQIKDINNGHHPESNGGWRNSHLNTCLLLMRNVLQKDSLRLCDTHFPYPVNLDELKELYNYVKNSEYSHATIYEKRRSNKSLILLSTYPTYILNKYSRKLKVHRSRYIDIQNCPTANFDVELFVINNGGRQYLTYIDATYRNARNAMKRLFPKPTPYEIPNCKLDIFDFEDGKPAPAKSVTPAPRRTQNQKAAPTPRPHRNPGKRR